MLPPSPGERTTDFSGGAGSRRSWPLPSSKRIVIGAWSKFDPGWIPTQQDFLDLTDSTQWHVLRAQFPRCPAGGTRSGAHYPGRWALCRQDVLHVPEARRLLALAVPDGLLPDPGYVNLVKADAANPTRGKLPTPEELDQS